MKRETYTVDITKPPIGPPLREFREGLFATRETEDSIEQNKLWHEYSDEYRKQLNNMKNTQNSRPLEIFGTSHEGKSLYAELVAKGEVHILHGTAQVGKSSNLAEIVQYYLDQNPK